MTYRSVVLILCAVLVVGSVQASAFGAGPSVSPKKDVHLEVRIIKAVKHPADAKKHAPDPRLKDVAPRIRQLFGFDTFRLETTKEAETSLDTMAIFSLPIDRDLMVKVSQKPDAMLVVNLAIKELLATDYTVASGGVLLIGGMKMADGVLVVAIRATLRP